MSADPYGGTGGEFFAPGPRREEKLWCPECGFTWWAEFYEEAGRLWPVEEDLECEECSAEGELP